MKKILIVDDEPDVREVVGDFLAFHGFKVVQAGNGQKALDMFQKEQPDAAVVDIEMPVMNGIAFSKEVLAQNQQFPIIIITAFLKRYSREDFDKIGVRDVLTKPLDLNTLNSYLQKIV